MPSTVSPAGGPWEGRDPIGGKTALLRHLHGLLCLRWEKGHVRRHMRDANIVTLYKNKGDRSDCNNYRDISLLSVVGKVFARIVLPHLQSLASSSPCFSSTPSTTARWASTSALEEAANFTTSPDCALRPRSVRSSFVRCCLPTTLRLRPTRRTVCKN
ncbi:unnamed protein product [Acanthosepion pharaonis]|uniref:Uncharacterized protein n=1 Tax=Acanthosepion pharaonis TaxID=158019 RepID=A0A812B1C6_ACAPH|nr:unnamed protein product [Sepia pharaonis]